MVSTPLAAEVAMSRKGLKLVPRNEAAFAGSEPHVLIVEDHVDARLVMEEFLESNGYATSVTKTVDEALALLRGGIPVDLVLLDLMLPGRDGIELLDAIRREPPPEGRLPVFIVSAFAPQKVKGANAVFSKPVDLAELLKRVKRLLPMTRH